jgi:hypothetical protein
VPAQKPGDGQHYSRIAHDLKARKARNEMLAEGSTS